MSLIEFSPLNQSEDIEDLEEYIIMEMKVSPT